MSSNDKNEAGILFFYTNLTKISEVSLADGSNVNIVKYAKYGKNMFLPSARHPQPDTFPWRGCTPDTDVMTMMLVSPTGTIISESTVVTPYSMTANDDFVVLSPMDQWSGDFSILLITLSSIDYQSRFILYCLTCLNCCTYCSYFIKEDEI
jgi:hypothetical protein